MNRIDLHTHSPCSDGALPLPDMLRRTKNVMGLSDGEPIPASLVRNWIDKVRTI